MHINSQGNLHRSSALTKLFLFLIVRLANMGLRNKFFFWLCAVIAFHLKVLRGGSTGRRQAGKKGVVLIEVLLLLRCGKANRL